MLCFRVIFWGIVVIISMVPFFFFVGIIGRIAGFRPGSRPGTVEKVFGWFGIIFLGGLMLAICTVAGLIDWGVATMVERGPNLQFREQPFGQNQPFANDPPFNNRTPVPQDPKPKPIPADWDEADLAETYLADMQEFSVRVGWGSFGKKGDLGYDVFGNRQVKANGKFYPNAISMHPPTNGFSTVKYRLNRDAKLFLAEAALTDTENPNFTPMTAATFAVFSDDQLLWISKPLQRPGARENCRLSVEGVDILELQIHCPGSNSHVRGVWLEPRVLK
jgi:hypothetical protein